MKKSILSALALGALSFQAYSATIDGYPLKKYSFFEEEIDVDLWDNYRTIIYSSDSRRFEIVDMDIRTPHFIQLAGDASKITGMCSIADDKYWADEINDCRALGVVDAYIITSKDNNFDKPVYFIAGADIAFGSQNLGSGQDKLTRYWNNKTLSPVFKRLLDRGKDIVFLSPLDGDHFITAKLFEHIKGNFQQGDYHSSVIGFSYGGLIGKKMISHLEVQGVAHNIYNYISFDAPHKGANIPHSLTVNFKRIQNRLSDIPGCQWVSFCRDSESHISRLLEQLTAGVAAKLLVTGNEADTYLAPTPYPLSTRNVAFSNGSYTGNSMNIPADTELIEFKVDYETWGDTQYSVKTMNISREYNVPHYYTTHVFDNAPGSYAMSGIELDYEFQKEASSNSAFSIIKSNLREKNLTPTFIPTVSALDMNTSELDRAFDISKAKTPFDKVYAVNGKNLRHDDFSYHADSLHYEINKKESDTATLIAVLSLI
ncbi:hypothetical protein J8M20_19800 [Pseudoalteromonas luteoviolacea]|uniref:alpha/beta hydrolase n=1 Tax=Pseudoalteromonas luteoviolacea TaxID=43657 RepID=UPI001B361AA9|nr:hypothetical protein [Pseudoalteromonas luteoviolacea]MBQ4813617.1 hypothetical protein [Pseudoalteromonas luteoviolacea]